MKNVKAIIFDAYGTLFDVNQLQKNVKIKLVVNGKVFQITGELHN